MKRRRLAALLLLLLSGIGALPIPAAQLEVDVLVYGGTSAGVIAAYTAKRHGKSVLLVEPGRHLGGMSSGGLGYTDVGNKYAVTGLALDFYRRVGRYYGRFEAWTFEPHVAEQVFEQYVDEAGVEVLFSRRLKRVEKVDTQIRTATLEYAGADKGSHDLVVAARQFIDATYEGDLMAMAGASYVVGREDNSVHGETHNGVQLRGRHQFPDGIDPYVVPGDPSSGLLSGITGIGVAPNGRGDKKVQAYNFRMCLCQGENRLPIEKPENYDPKRYELLIRIMEKQPWKKIEWMGLESSLYGGFIIASLPNGKTDWNHNGAFSTDYIGKNWDYPEADYARRAKIWQEHEDYQKGLLHFIATDPRVPEHIREEMRSWGHCQDEFLDTGGWPHQLYVREARRLVGEYIMTEHNALGTATVDDGIGMASLTIDSHNTQRVVVNGIVKNEGNVEVGCCKGDDLDGEVIVNPYPVSYRSITPKREEVTNLLVPVTLSASHIAYGSIRMEPVFMVLGQSAAVAASMAIDAGMPVQQVDVPALQQELRENPLADGSSAEVLVDDRFQDQVLITGRWKSAELPGRYGPTVLRSERQEGGAVRFVPRIATPGTYRVYLLWPMVADLASNAPVTIRHAAGTERITVDLRRSDEGVQEGYMISFPRRQSLGEFSFEPGREAWLQLGASGVDGAVLADAVLFVPVRVWE